MLDNKDRYRCDAEIGSVKRGWHTCGRPAVVQSEKRILGQTLFLEFCDQHAARATQEGRSLHRRLN